jgi:RNA polymerase sigma-70 factor (ECF subfamily)
MDLEILLQRCRSRDDLAWEALVRLYQGRVYGIAVHYVGSPEEARDVAQEIFVRVYRHLDRCADAEHFLPWLIRIARNACVDHLRRRKARPPASDVPAEDVMLASDAPTPEDEWSAASRRQMVHTAIQTLGELSREMILLREIQGLSLDEIARTLDIPIGTVKSRCNRARLELAAKVIALSGGRYGQERA